MPGTRIITASWLGVAFGGLLAAQPPDYFPLDRGNVWIYRCTGACTDTTVTVQVPAAPDPNGTSAYVPLQGWFGQNFAVRKDDAGSVFALAPDGSVQTWYLFQTAEGETYTEALPSCCGKALLKSRSAHYEGPLGSFDTALEIDYPGVFQVGVYREFFLPYVGLVYRTEAAGGPAVRTYDLIYARLGGNTVVAQPEISVSVALDRAVYAATDSANLTARLMVRNGTSDALSLTFPSGQRFDLEIRNENGDVVYQWSRGRLFTQAITTQQLTGEIDYAITAPLADLAPGKYVARAWLAIAGPDHAYSASSAFEIR